MDLHACALTCVCVLCPCQQTLQAPTADTNTSGNSVLPSPLSGAIDKAFGNFTAFKAKMTEAGLGVFGSGACMLLTPYMMGRDVFSSCAAASVNATEAGNESTCQQWQENMCRPASNLQCPHTLALFGNLELTGPSHLA